MSERLRQSDLQRDGFHVILNFKYGARNAGDVLEEIGSIRLRFQVPCAGAGGAGTDEYQTEENIMATEKLDKAAWHTTFDQMSKSLLVGKEVKIEVTGLNIGDQIEQEWIQLLGITYDPKSDLIEILVEGLDHTIPKPREIWIDHGAIGLVSMAVIDADDVRQIIRLREPLMLPFSGTA